MDYFDANFLNDVISSIGPNFSDTDTYQRFENVRVTRFKMA